MKIKIVPSILKVNFDTGNRPEAIVIHETDNTDPGADARAHASYFNNPDNEVSVHYVADENEIIQLLSHDKVAWHCGGGTRFSNRNTIGIEICVNGDYEKARQNAIALTSYLLKYTGIKTVIRHFDITGKWCPRKMMDRPELWKDFLEKVKSFPVDSVEITSGDKETAVNDGKIRAVVVSDNAVVRKGRGTSSEIMGKLPRGEKVVCLYLKDNWWSIDYGPTYGFIPSSDIRLL